MSDGGSRVFRGSGQPGSNGQVASLAHRRRARKLEREVQVRFARTDCLVRTREGSVAAHRGDAIITGTAGEQWRVSRSHFDAKYRPGPDTANGADGGYVSRPYEIHAVRMEEPFEVLLTDGASRLHGREGDWLVDYGDGSLGIVAPEIFDGTYALVD
ncbi:MAG: PGDYG domain-containing protein [Steroidobacteraceae bacterium]